MSNTELERKAEEYALERNRCVEQYTCPHGCRSEKAFIAETKRAYLAGAREACRWRKCSEELPRPGELVLGIVMGLPNNMVEPDKMFLDPRGQWQMREAQGKPVFPPTHWQSLPLPPAPEGEKDKLREDEPDEND